MPNDYQGIVHVELSLESVTKRLRNPDQTHHSRYT